MKPKTKYLGTGGANKAAQAVKKSQKTKQQRLNEIMKSIPNTSNKR